MLRLRCLRIFIFLLSSTKFISGDNASNELNNGRDVDIGNCTLQTESKRMQHYLDQLIDQDNRLIKLNIIVKWNLHPPNDTFPEHMSWFITTNNAGQHLLLLEDNFTVMSLGTLSYGIAEMHLSFLQEPGDCLGNMTADDADHLLKLSLLTLPRTPKAINEDEVSILHICTGTVNSDGSCCNISLSDTKGKVKCDKLLENVWMDHFGSVILILSVIALSHCTCIFPKAVDEPDDNRSFYVSNNKLKLRMKVVTEQPTDNTWTEVKDLDNLQLKDICHKLEDRINSVERTSIDEEAYILFVESVEKKDDELVSELSTSHGLLRSLYKTLGNIFMWKISCKTKLNFSECMCRFTCLSAVFKFLCIVICSSLLIVRAVFGIVLTPSTQAPIILTVFFIMWSAVLTLTKLPINEILKESLQVFHKFNLDVKYKLVVSLLREPVKLKYPWYTCFLLPFSFFLSLLLAMTFSLPVLLFTAIFLKTLFAHLSEGKIKSFYYFLCLTYVYTGLYLILDCTLFYTECLAYIMIGLFLNYEQIIDKIILIVMISLYIFNCVSRVYLKINTFNQKVINLVHKLNKDAREELFNTVIEDDRNIASRLSLDSNQNERCVKILVGNDGRPFLSVNGLYLFHKYEEPDHLPYLHIPKLFLDQLASQPGHLTPGPKHWLLFRVWKEILFMLLALLAIFVVLDEYSTFDNISATAHTMVTIGSSAILITFNSLIFTTTEYSINDQDLHLKALVKRQLRNFKDFWIHAKLDIHSRDYRVTDSPSFLPVNWYDGSSACDILAVVFRDIQGTGKVKSFFVKTFHENDTDLYQEIRELFSSNRTGIGLLDS